MGIKADYILFFLHTRDISIDARISIPFTPIGITEISRPKTNKPGDNAIPILPKRQVLVFPRSSAINYRRNQRWTW